MAEMLSDFGHIIGLNGSTQVAVMPTYSTVATGTIVQYVGTTDANYTNGYFYKATASGWEAVDVQGEDTDKADKVDSATAGNLAGLNASGNLTDAGWSADKTTSNASGNPISISGLKSNQLAVNPIITLEPIQAGSGDPSPSNIRAISGYDKIEVLSTGKNIWNLNIDLLKSLNTEGTWTGNTYAVVGVTFAVEVNSKGIVTKIVANGTPSSGHATLTCYKSNTSIFNGLQLRASGYPANIGRFLIGSNYLTSEYLNTLYDSIGTIPNETSGTEILIQIMSGQTANNYEIYPMLTLSSVTDTTFEPYNPYGNIQLTLGQTIYGGTLDVEKGILTVDKKCRIVDGTEDMWYSGYSIVVKLGTTDIDINNVGQTILNDGVYYSPDISDSAAIYTGAEYDWEFYCIHYNCNTVDAFKAYVQNNPIQLVYPLADSARFTIQLTPHEISLLKDYAYVSTNGTNMTFSYKNGEMASLGDVESLGKTMNLLGNSLDKSCDTLLAEVTNNSDPANFVTYTLNCTSLANYRLLVVAAGWYTENYPSAYTVLPNINGKFGIGWTTIYLNNNPSSSYIKIINLNNTSRSIDVSSSNVHCTVSVYGIK